MSAESNSTFASVGESSASTPPTFENKGYDSEEALNIAWTVGFSVIVIVGTLGNGIVIWIIAGERE